MTHLDPVVSLQFDVVVGNEADQANTTLWLHYDMGYRELVGVYICATEPDMSIIPIATFSIVSLVEVATGLCDSSGCLRRTGDQLLIAVRDDPATSVAEYSLSLSAAGAFANAVADRLAPPGTPAPPRTLADEVEEWLRSQSNSSP